LIDNHLLSLFLFIRLQVCAIIGAIDVSTTIYDSNLLQ